MEWKTRTSIRLRKMSNIGAKDSGEMSFPGVFIA